MGRRLVIFGERPGLNTDPERPLYPHTTTGAAARLIKLLDWGQAEYLDKTRRYNAFHDGMNTLDLKKAREWVNRVMLSHAGDKFVFVGRETSRAAPVGYRNRPFGEVVGPTLTIPHTSGVTRFWNDPEATFTMACKLRNFAQDCR